MRRCCIWLLAESKLTRNAALRRSCEVKTGLMVDKPQRRKYRALKRADDALYARKMPKGKWKTWGVAVAIKDVNGKTIMNVREGHEKARWFKGMAQLLVERQTFQVSRRRNSLLLPSTNVQPTQFRRMKDQPSSEVDLEQDVITSLDAVPLSSMRRSALFIDAHRKGFNGVQAVWVIKNYRGHHERDFDLSAVT
ncbi:hypothetical protein K503DRAFT_786117 [Rhizopogon vinicolor AM-OR11-026]|uniref:Uncharacterized protein n=1 Tax=Rhizopogon vinicolor AM-OR11-026 TaxID=1314800 RepID=A0A1B7MMX9_9AGAM|nr:hypothetical protein K503DRAFT_786117 [Rhizopogon vinicolor AM-OR11-026]